MTDERSPGPAGPLSGRTAWARNLQTPLRVFLRTETGSAAVLAAMAVAALAWINIDASSYHSVWGTQLPVRVGGLGVSLDLAGLGEQRPDDVFLLRVRAGGPPRIRHG